MRRNTKVKYVQINRLRFRFWVRRFFLCAQGYAKIFIDNGYQNTNFLGMLTEIDLKRLGIKKLGHRRNLRRRI